MCGIVGYVGFDYEESVLRTMMRRIRHRGPDGDGAFRADRVGLGMTRLSIIDLPGGGQPIYNEDRSLLIFFNGEIYNYQSLRRSLVQRGHTFTTDSDTEVILHLFEDLGPKCLDQLEGMFTFCIYDLRTRALFLARDRLGVKPLYYWHHDGKLVFASELKAVIAAPDVERAPNLRAIDDYLALRYVPGPETMVEGVHKFPAAHYAWLKDGRLTFERYWRLDLLGESSASDAELQEQFDQLFEDAVRKRLVSDVPVGAFLSGGVDSSAIVAAMARASVSKVKTFSVGFAWAGDELGDARVVAEHLGCQHEEVVCTADDLALLPKIVWHLDEPIGDAITIPMYLLARAARREVKVVLSGEGADEILAGYFPHKVLTWAQRYRRIVPRFLRESLVEAGVAALPSSLLSKAFDYPASLGEEGKRKLLDFLRRASRSGPAGCYYSLISLFGPEDRRALYTPETASRLESPRSFADDPLGPAKNPLDRLLALQYDNWLPDDILNKMDKMTMANSIEGREPFMDHRLVEFLMTVPPRLKLRAGANKVLLRSYLSRALPQGVSKRKKKAFYFPAEKFTDTKPLRDLLESCLGESAVKRRGYFRWDAVRSLKDSLGRGEFVRDKQVLSLMILELWHRQFVDGEVDASP